MDLEIKDKNNSLKELRLWLLEQNKMNPRTDDNFLIIFLNNCEYDMDLTKKTINKFYQNKLKIPQWWKSRDLNEPIINILLHANFIVPIQDENKKTAPVILNIPSRGPPNIKQIDKYFKLATICLEKIARWQNYQMNGLIFVVDCRQHPFWPIPRLCSPTILKNFLSSFYMGFPMKINKLIVLEPTFLFSTFLKLVFPFLPRSLKENIIVIASDWSVLFDSVPKDQLPEEYGGTAGPISKHEDAFIKELMAFNEYLIADDDFGYSS